MKRNLTLGACAALAALATAPVSFAATTLDLDRVITGGNPASSPFATFHSNSGGVEVIIGGLQLGTPEFLRSALFNFSGNASGLTFTHLSGQVAETVTAGNNAFTAGPAGVFDIQFNYATGANARFEAGETSAYLISGAGLKESMFNVLDQTGTFFAAAHVLNGGGGGGSGFVGAVPEAETYAMLLAGLGLLGFMVNRRKRPVFPTL
jgi:hypothetical protein